MKRRWVLALIAANLAVLFGVVLRYPDLMISPGPLAPAHAEIATDCFACHAPMRGAVSERCISCHAVADIGLRGTKGQTLASSGRKVAFHKALTSQDCASCHIGHEGSALALAGRKPFSHELLPPATAAKCDTCHTSPEAKTHPIANANCGLCHSPKGWKPATFDHAKLFVLEGPHSTPCATCHVNNDTSRYNCFGCHEHQPDRIRAKHVREGIANFENCAKCHRSAGGKQGSGERGED